MGVVHSGKPPLVTTEPATVRLSFRGPPAQGPRLAVRGAKGCSQKRHYAQANLTEIKRILSALTTREERVASAERKLVEANRRLRVQIAGLRDTKLPPEQILEDARYVNLKERREHEIARVKNAQEWRTFTVQRLRLYLDHALTTTPFVTRKCKACEGDGVISGGACSVCHGAKVTKIENPNPFARAAVPILKHLSRVLEEAELCFKIRARTEDSKEAFQRLLDSNQGLVKKFGNPIQTALEGDDAEQGAILGLFDGAKRFDPTRPTHYYCPVCEVKSDLQFVCPECGDELAKGTRCDGKRCGGAKGIVRRSMTCGKCGLDRMMMGTSTATYRTYAWNWTKRNSRARKDTEKRPGLVHASLDDPSLGGKGAEDGGVSDQVTMIGGRAQISDGSREESDPLGLDALDLRNQIGDLEDPQQRDVLTCILESMQPGEIAVKMGITTRRVAKIKDEAFAAMRRKLAGYLEV